MSLERAVPPALRSQRFERCFLVEGMTRQGRAQFIGDYLTSHLLAAPRANTPAQTQTAASALRRTASRTVAATRTARSSQTAAQPARQRAADTKSEQTVKPPVKVNAAKAQLDEHPLGDGVVSSPETSDMAAGGGSPQSHGALLDEAELEHFPVEEKERKAELAIEQELLDISGK